MWRETDRHTHTHTRTRTRGNSRQQCRSVAMATRLCQDRPGTQRFSLMRQTRSFRPSTCVPSSLSAVPRAFYHSRSTQEGREEGGRRGYDCSLCIYFVQCWGGKLLLCALMWDPLDKCEKDCLPQLTGFAAQRQCQGDPARLLPPLYKHTRTHND